MHIVQKEKNPFNMEYIEEFQFNWIPGKNDKSFLERKTNNNFMILLTNKEPSIHSSKTPFESYSSEQKYVPWVKVGSAKLNPLLLCIANTYKYYIFWIHKRGGNIFHHILDVLIPLKNWPWIFHWTTNILNFEEKISWTTLTSSLQRVGRRHSRNGRRVALVQNSDRISA